MLKKSIFLYRHWNEFLPNPIIECPNYLKMKLRVHLFIFCLLEFYSIVDVNNVQLLLLFVKLFSKKTFYQDTSKRNCRKITDQWSFRYLEKFDGIYFPIPSAVTKLTFLIHLRFSVFNRPWHSKKKKTNNYMRKMLQFLGICGMINTVM